MAHFIGLVNGRATTQGSRLGTKKSGINTTVSGWDFGVNVRGFYDEKLNEDIFEIYINGGSNRNYNCKKIGTFRKSALTK
jgi:hypothetical protein